jgi:hypothetical protein
MKSKQYSTFTEALEKVLSVTPSEIKRHVVAEKIKRKFIGKKRGPKTPASGRASTDKG